MLRFSENGEILGNVEIFGKRHPVGRQVFVSQAMSPHRSDKMSPIELFWTAKNVISNDQSQDDHDGGDGNESRTHKMKTAIMIGFERVTRCCLKKRNPANYAS